MNLNIGQQLKTKRLLKRHNEEKIVVKNIKRSLSQKKLYCSNGFIASITWSLFGKVHKDKGPAYVMFDSKGNPYYYSYFKHGLLHKKNGPARESLTWKEYYIDGELHREDGPAIISYTNQKKDEILEEDYFLRGIKYDELEYWIKVEELNKSKK